MSGCDTHVTESGTLAFRVALSVLRHREDAEDVAQEAVVRSLQRFQSLRDRTRFRAWLVRLTWRLALNRRRADTRRAARDLRLVANEFGQGTAEHELILRERADRLWAAIDELPPRLRLPLVLGRLQGHSLDEVASLLGVPVGTIKSRTFEARNKLRQRLIGAGVVTALLVFSMLAWRTSRRAQPVQEAAVAQALQPVVPIAAAVAPASVAPVRPSPLAVPKADAFISVPSDAVTVRPPIALPVVSVPMIEVHVVDTLALHVPVVHVPVVDVQSIEIQPIKTPGAPEFHPEKKP
jgi:RNA polymerase sigma-70 factor (ECF subfamily)